MKTTLNQIHKHFPCAGGWTKLLKHLGKTQADDEPLSIATIVELNGLDDALWCLRAVEGYDKEIRLYAVWCARQVQHLMSDKRSLNALDVAERYAHGRASNAELSSAWGAAGDAACEAVRYAAGDAAWGAAREQTGDAAWSAARESVWAVENSERASALVAQEQELLRICAETDAFHGIKETTE